MSSATKVDGGRGGLQAAERELDEAGEGDWLTPRQRRLSHYWSYFRCSNYDGRSVAWDGTRALDHVERETVATAPYTPPGFFDAGQTREVPLELRRPSVPYYLAKVIVRRFTSLLFTPRRHPKVSVPDDPVTDDWLSAALERSHFWARMVSVRNYGGGMGAVGVGFRVADGEVVWDIFDARWSTPTFDARDRRVVRSIEVRYQYEADLQRSDGTVVRGRFWYRRVVDEQRDVVWARVPVREEEPNWEAARHDAVAHGYGFCPVVWIQNQVVEDELDGDPDCHGAFDLIERADGVRSQAFRGTMANCDPTLNVNTDAELPEVMTGSSMALKLEKGGSAKFLEISGSGPAAGRETAEELEARALVLTRCFLDTNEGGPSRTAKEVESNMSSMLDAADELRVQYGAAVTQLLQLFLRAVRRLTAVRAVPLGGGDVQLRRGVVRLPPRVVRDDSGAAVESIPRTSVGSGEQVELAWPAYLTPTPEVVSKAVDAAGRARMLGVMDLNHAVRYLAPYFGVENVAALVKALAESASASSAALESRMLERMRGGGV